MTPGEKVFVTNRIHGRSNGKNVVTLKTSEGVFCGFHGPKSCVIEFTRPDGSKVRQVVLLKRISAKGEKC
jgi:hypothetical protein